MKKILKWLYPIGAFAFGGLLLSMAFGDVMIHPNQYMTEGGGDGLKNHYAFAYYIKYDKGLMFSGMQHPYGEHLFYPDAQPLLSAPLAWIHRNIMPMDKYSIGISNIIMLYSVGFCALFIFLIMRRMNLPAWYSLIFAGLIAALSPQIYRFIAHQALGQTVYIPMLWYFLIRFEDSEKKKWLWGIAVGLLPILFGSYHLYYLPLGCFFILSYAFIYAIAHFKTLKKHIPMLLGMLAMVIIPIVLAQVFIHSTDPYLEQRTQNPWGFFYYKARFESIFLPQLTPFQNLIEFYVKTAKTTFEGYGSVGIVGSLVLLFTIIRFFTSLFKKKIKRFSLTANPLLNRYLWSSFLLLLFSMCVPFIWGMEWILDYLPQLKQFRSIGRFNWAFYYVYTIFSAYYIYLLYKRFRQKKLYSFALTFLLSIILFWVLNDYAFLRHVRKYNWNAVLPNTFKIEPEGVDSLKAVGFKSEDYQGIIALPFHLRGSEKIHVQNSTESIHYSFKYSYHLGLPLTNSYIARAPITGFGKITQMFSDTLITKEVLDDLPNDKPFLAAYFEKEGMPMNAHEKALVAKGEYLASAGNAHFYKISLAAFETNTQPVIDRFQEKENLIAQTFNGATFYLSDSNVVFDYKGFENQPFENVFVGKGSLNTLRGEPLLLFEGEISETDTVLVSVWYEVNYLDAFPHLYHEAYEANGRQMYKGVHKVEASPNYENGWIRHQIEIPPHPKGVTQKIYIGDRDRMVVDEFLIQKKGSEVFRKADDSTLMYNNFRVRY